MTQSTKTMTGNNVIETYDNYDMEFERNFAANSLSESKVKRVNQAILRVAREVEVSDGDAEWWPHLLDQ